MAIAASVRPVSTRLAIAIFLFPGIFAWFTLRSGYSILARAVSFGWAFLSFILVIATGAGGNHSEPASIQVAQAADVAPAPAPAPVQEPAAPAVQQAVQTSGSQTGFGAAPAAPVPSGGMPVTAQELANAYEGNEVAAQARYGNQTLLVSGVVEKVGLDLMDNPQINLIGDGTFRNVTIQLEKSASNVAATINKGQSITVRCQKITEVMSMPVLDDCTF